MKHITNHRHLALAVAMAAVLASAGCSSAVETDNTVPETEAVVETTESVEESAETTEAFVPETELETESTEAETTETVESESESESTEVSETEATVVENETTVIESEASPKAETMSYTFTDMSTTMYAKSSVNVRSLPSTDGSRLGSLAKNQAVTVTGQCNETGWYRIAYDNGEAYVSNKYLSDTAVAESASTSTAGANTSASTDPYIALMEAAIAQFGPNIIIYDNQTVCDSRTGEQLGVISNGQIVATTEPATNAKANGLDRAAAEEIWSYMNAERTAAGLNEIAWDENIYNFACQRAQAIVTDYSHNGRGHYAENCAKSASGAYNLHMQWYNSSEHHNNYMKEGRTTGACAVYYYNGIYYGVENFSTDLTTREVNGQSVSVTQAEAAAIDAGNTWTASNGIVLYIDAGGDVSCNACGEEATAAILEYYSCH